MDILFAVISILILVYSSILHEIAHGYVAYRMGDPTAQLRGRLTLNPKPHIDPYMTIVLPLILFFSTQGRFIFGGAKPVPVDPYNLKDGVKDLAVVSLAGPATNLVLAVLGSFILHAVFPHAERGLITSSNDVIFRSLGFLGFFLAKTIEWNLVLAIFNLIPIPPLDGSKIFALVLPKREAIHFLEIGQRMGMFLLIFLLFFPIGGFSLMGIVSTLINFSLRILGF